MSKVENLKNFESRLGVKKWLDKKSLEMLSESKKETNEKRKSVLSEYHEMLRSASEVLSAQIALCEQMEKNVEALKEKIRILTLDDFELKTKTDEKAKESSIQPNNSFLDDTHGNAPF